MSKSTPAFTETAARQRLGVIDVKFGSGRARGHHRSAGIFSHLACADEPKHASIAMQRDALVNAIALAHHAGLTPQTNHLANSAATLTRPDTHFDLVRTGLALYGLSPLFAPGDFGLRPAMTLTAPVAAVRSLGAGETVSYGLSWRAAQQTRVALIPLGYADGIPRALSGKFSVMIAGRSYPSVGRICMDQFLVNLGSGQSAITAGTPAILFGPEGLGTLPLQDWAKTLDTIPYELVTAIRGRVRHQYLN
jgi:alanine racemase